MKEKHIPLRMCMGCRQMRPKSEMLRVVRENETGQVKLDETGKSDGRGAYLCRRETCFRIALKKRALEKNFKKAVPKEIYEALKERTE